MNACSYCSTNLRKNSSFAWAAKKEGCKTPVHVEQPQTSECVRCKSQTPKDANLRLPRANLFGICVSLSVYLNLSGRAESRSSREIVPSEGDAVRDLKQANSHTESFHMLFVTALAPNP